MRKNRALVVFYPLLKILREGNEAQQWLQLHGVGVDIQRVITQAIIATQKRETELESKLCLSMRE